MLDDLLVIVILTYIFLSIFYFTYFKLMCDIKEYILMLYINNVKVLKFWVAMKSKLTRIFARSSWSVFLVFLMFFRWIWWVLHSFKTLSKKHNQSCLNHQSPFFFVYEKKKHITKKTPNLSNSQNYSMIILTYVSLTCNLVGCHFS